VGLPIKPKTPYLFLIPSLVLIFLFIVYPIVKTIWLSFFSAEGEFVGLDNFVEVLRNPDIVNADRIGSEIPPWGALVHNAIWIALHLPLCVFLGLIFAVILQDVKGASIVKSIVFMGMVLPMAIGGLLAGFLFDKDMGIVNLLLRTIGITSLSEKSWTAWPETALLATILTGVWAWTGFSMIVYSAALATIPKEYLEAADIDQASSFRKFIHITIPLLKPATLTIVVMSILYELKILM